MKVSIIYKDWSIVQINDCYVISDPGSCNFYQKPFDSIADAKNEIDRLLLFYDKEITSEEISLMESYLSEHETDYFALTNEDMDNDYIYSILDDLETYIDNQLQKLKNKICENSLLKQRAKHLASLKGSIRLEKFFVSEYKEILGQEIENNKKNIKDTENKIFELKKQLKDI